MRLARHLGLGELPLLPEFPDHEAETEDHAERGDELQSVSQALAIHRVTSPGSRRAANRPQASPASSTSCQASSERMRQTSL